MFQRNSFSGLKSPSLKPIVVNRLESSASNLLMNEDDFLRPTTANKIAGRATYIDSCGESSSS
jgi:hypothetical protein